MPVHGGSVPA
jgi:ubiquitin carboxyl-terminal hydrolase 25